MRDVPLNLGERHRAVEIVESIKNHHLCVETPHWWIKTELVESVQFVTVGICFRFDAEVTVFCVHRSHFLTALVGLVLLDMTKLVDDGAREVIPCERIREKNHRLSINALCDAEIALQGQ